MTSGLLTSGVKEEGHSSCSAFSMCGRHAMCYLRNLRIRSNPDCSICLLCCRQPCSLPNADPVSRMPRTSPLPLDSKRGTNSIVTATG